MVTMVVAVLVLAVGYVLGGASGDFLFKRTPRGRLLVATTAALLGTVLLFFTLKVPHENQTLFLLMLSATALFVPFPAPNVTSTVFDVTPPEVRSTAASIQYFIESAGAALAPLIAGVIAVRSSLGNAILLICISAWVLCTIALALASTQVPHDIEALREQMRQRAQALGAPGN